MQKLLICLTLAAFATITSLQAGEQGCQMKAAACTQAKTGCCSASTSASASCSASTAASGSKSCTRAAKIAKRNTEVKGATLLVQR